MPSREITYTTRNNEAFTGYYTHPDGNGPFPGILLITAIWGTDNEMKELADAWAADGFVVSVPDIFWRVLSGPTADRSVAFDRYGKFDVDQGMLDIEDLIQDLKARPECNGKVGVLGFCFGGRYAHLAAARLGVDAAGAYHGTKIGDHLDETPQVTCPVSFHFGAVDPAVPMDEVEAIKAAYATHSNAEIVVYPEAAHNFAMLYKAGYQEAAPRLPAPLSCVASRTCREDYEGALGVAPEAVKQGRATDLVVVGCVAVAPDGGRTGKGAGFADLELGMLRHLGLVQAATPVMTYTPCKSSSLASSPCGRMIGRSPGSSHPRRPWQRSVYVPSHLACCGSTYARNNTPVSQYSGPCDPTTHKGDLVRCCHCLKSQGTGASQHVRKRWERRRTRVH